MKEQISVCMVQPDLIWEDVGANLRMLDAMLEDVPAEVGLIILPETFSTGFTMRSEQFAEDVNGKSAAWMRKTASERNARITGSMIVRENGKIYNRLYWVSPEGIEGHYDKRHLFRLGREDESFIPGSSRKVFSLGPFRFMPLICYDLRFPVFSRYRGDYDVLIYVANWPAVRQNVWETLLRARAIENQSYVLGVNRVGTDGEGVAHVGSTCAFNPPGDKMKQMENRPGIGTLTLDLKKLREFRTKFPVWKDADRFTLD